MDLQGSLVNTKLSIYPSNNLLNYFKSLQIDDNVPINIAKFVKGKDYEIKQKNTDEESKKIPVHFTSKDIENLNKIKSIVKVEEAELNGFEDISEEQTVKQESKCEKSENTNKHTTTKTKEDANEVTKNSKNDCNGKTKESQNDGKENTKKTKEDCNENTKNESSGIEDDLHLTTSNIDWLYRHLENLRSKGGKDVPYLYELLEGSDIRTPKNAVIKRNPVLEARCVKLRAQQEAREYRKMTKSVDNVRMRFPEDSISYQLKQVNRQLIAIGQFIISIFAGFLFGFKGVEWMIGSLDFGFRLLLGVMCALVIALAEIYFLAKKLNEELNVPETVQLGGPPKFVDPQYQPPQYDSPKIAKKAIEKEHKD